jgi:hypothetical protein
MNDEGGQATYHNLHGALNELRNVFGGAGKLEYHHEKDNETWIDAEVDARLHGHA